MWRRSRGGGDGEVMVVVSETQIQTNTHGLQFITNKQVNQMMEFVFVCGVVHTAEKRDKR